MEKEGRGRAMISEREHKVAVATVDGRVIAEDFGSAPLFVVARLRKGKVLEEELRVNRRECPRDAEDTRAGCWELMQDLLADVRVVICRGMGESAYVELLRRDVLPITTEEEDAGRAIAAYLRDRLKEDPGRVHRPKHDRYREGDEEGKDVGSWKGDVKDLGDV